MKSTRRKNLEGVLIVLFGLPFFAGGCVTGYLAYNMISRYVAARSWLQTPVTIRDLQLESSSGEDSTTYRVKCTYAYDFEGKSYESTRVGLSTMSDNIGSWQQRTHARLDAARKRPPVYAFVDPADPSQALLDRDMRLWLLLFLLIFVTIFGGVGAGIIAAGIFALRPDRRGPAGAVGADELEAKPWLLNPKWASGIIRSSSRAKAIGATIAALYWNAIWLPFVVFVQPELAAGDHLAWLALIPPVLGLILGIVAARAIIRYRKFGRSYFDCTPLPGIVGGRLQGTMVLVGEIAGLDNITLHLRCQNTLSERRGGKSSSQTRTIWESTSELPPPSARFGEQEARLPVRFDIPASCRPTDTSTTGNKIEWKLSARSSVVGVDLLLDFDIPIFRTEQSAPATDEAQVEAEEDPAVDAPEPPAMARIRRMEDESGHTVWIASAWPGFRFAGMVFLFLVIFTGACVFLGIGVYRGNWFLVLFLLVFGLVTLLMWAIFFSLFGSYRVRLAGDQIEVRRTFVFFAKRRTISTEDLDLSFKEAASAGARRWYAVFAQPAEGRKVCLAGMIEGNAGAKWFIRQIEGAITQPTTTR